MLIFKTILLAAGTLALVEASAIKGGHAHVRQADAEARSLKQSPVQAHDKRTPILESTKRLFNDESLRRLAAQPALAPAQPLVPAPVAVHEAPKRQEVVQPVAQSAPVATVPQPAEQHAAPVVPVVRDQRTAESTVEAKSGLEKAVVEPKKADDKSEVEPKSDKPSEKAPELAQMGPRSSVVKVDESVAVPVSVPVAAPASPEVAPVAPVVPVVAVVPVEASPVVPVVAPQAGPLDSPVAAQVVPAESVAVASAPAQAAPVAPVQPVVPDHAHVPVPEAPLEARKEEPVAGAAVKEAGELHIEVPAPDPGLVLSEPIDSTTKLLIDLDEHVQKFLPAEEQAQPPKELAAPAHVEFSLPNPAEAARKPTGPLVPYASVDEPIVPPLPSLDGVEKASAQSSAVAPAAGQSVGSQPAQAARQGGSHQNQQQVITQLLDQMDSLQNRIQDTINQLVARRRYVMAALLRPMGTYVRRVRTNLERLQNRVNQLQAAAVSVGGGQNRPGGFVDAAAIETIRRRIDDISKRISDIVNRIRFSLTPTSAPLNSNGK